MSTIVACFEAQLAKAMQRVKIILDTTRNPQFAGDVPHVYEDKYLLADYLTNSMLAAEMTVLDFLGLNGEHRARIQGWQKAGQSVSLRFRASQTCKLVRQADRKVESPSSTSHSVTVLGITASSTSKVVTTIHEWFWNIEAEWELLLFTGTDVEAALVLLQNKGQVEQITNSDRSPAPAVTAHPHIDVNITWLAQQLDDNGKFNFTIDRSVDSCRTPRRNVQIASALTFNHELLMWFASIQRFFHDKHFPQQSQGSLQMSILSEHDLFVPILPLFEEANSDQSPSSQSSSLPAARVTSSSPSSPSSSSSSSSSTTPSGSDSEPQLLAESTASESSSVLLSRQDLQRFLTDNRAGIVGKLGELERLFPRDGRLITAAEALVCVLTLHGGAVGSIYLQSLEYIEGLLYKQLHAAIGKDVTPSDFAEYMRFHNRKLFREEFEPGMFCYAVRRPEHYPEGVLSIEATTTGLPEPILASSRRIEPSFPMSFALNAATSVTFHGARYAHAWINYSFEGQSGVSLALNARARQFSSFILLVGKVLSATQFEPTGAMIIQNKDDLSIPLLLEQIPTPKEFKDATASLSPEQRRFAKAYREMQLASTLFGVCIIQIKPQLEKLLRLPPDALTKEIKLTQDLLQLFIRYQIPSDLLSYAGADDASLDTKLQVVSGQVDGMLAMVEQQIEDQRVEAARVSVPEVRHYAPASSYSTTCALDDLLCIDEDEVACGAVIECESIAADPFADFTFCSDGIAPVALQEIQLPAEQPPAQPQQQQQQQQQQESQQQQSQVSTGSTVTSRAHFDYSQLPEHLNRAFKRLDTDGALRPTIIKVGDGWTRKRQATLLSPVVSQSLSDDDKTTEKNQAFDLLDALSRSGSLPFDDASFHVVVASTHCFTKSVTDTVIQDNVNPIAKVERSALIVASTIQDCPTAQLVKDDQLSRVQAASPALF